MSEKELTKKIHIEYCKKCNSHNWCTHHDQRKYQRTFTDLSIAIQKQFPDLVVLENPIPSYYVPFRVKQNKYYDSANNKYVIYPSIGSFQVHLDNKLIFSKKQTNTWPNIEQVLSDISQIVRGKPIKNSLDEEDVKTEKQTILKANTYLNSINTRTTFYKEKGKKKEFTLTDHFRHYKMNKENQLQKINSLFAESQPIKEHKVSKITAQDIEELHEVWGKKEDLPHFITDKAFIEERKGKKEMLVNLSSIEEENDCNILKKKNSQFLQQNLDKQFNNIENKFNFLEKKVEEVNRIKDQFEDYDYWKKKSLTSEKKVDHYPFNIADKIQQVNSAYQAQKIMKGYRNKKQNKIQQYINSSKHEKNEKLQEIYGPHQIKKLLDFQSLQKKNKKKQEKENTKSHKIKSKKEQSHQTSSSEESEEDSMIEYPHYINKIKKKQTTSLHSQDSHKKFYQSEKNFHQRKQKPEDNQKIQSKTQSRSYLKSEKQQEKKHQEEKQHLKKLNNHNQHRSRVNLAEKFQKNDQQQKKAEIKKIPFSKKRQFKISQIKEPRKNTQDETSRSQHKKKIDQKQKKIVQNSKRKSNLSVIHEKLKNEQKTQKLKENNFVDKKLFKKSKINFNSFPKESQEQQEQKKTEENRKSKDKKENGLMKDKLIEIDRVKEDKKEKKQKKQEKKQEKKEDKKEKNHRKQEKQFQKGQEKKVQKSHRKLKKKQQQKQQKEEQKQGKKSSKKKEKREQSREFEQEEKKQDKKLKTFRRANKRKSIEMKKDSKEVSEEKLHPDKSKKSKEKKKSKETSRKENTQEKQQKSKEKKKKKKNKEKQKQKSENEIIERQYPSQHSQKSRFRFEISENQSIKEKQKSQIGSDFDKKSSRKLKKKGKKSSRLAPDVVEKGIQKTMTPRQKQIQVQLEQQKSKNRNSKEKQSKQRSQTVKKHNNQKQNNRTTRQGRGKSQISEINKQEEVNEGQRARILKQLYGNQLEEEQLKYFEAVKMGKKRKIEWKDENISLWGNINDIYKGKKKLFGFDSIKPELVKSKNKASSNLIKIIRMLCLRNQFLIIRLFENAEYYEAGKGIFGVWLCDHYQWKCFVVDQQFPISENNEPLFLHHEQKQLWPIVLEKALAMMFGGYQELEKKSICELFHALVGSNYVKTKIKQDMTKNKIFLKHLSENQKKNFIIFCEKRYSSSIEEEKRDNEDHTVFYVLSQKTVNNNQVLIKMKKNNSDSFWVKLEKFVQEFQSMNILQLRVNHNFTSLELPSFDIANFMIVEMNVPDESFGSITISNKYNSGSLRVFLYREQEENMLKLVGKAKQKNKQNLFFDCCFNSLRYFLFIEAAHPRTRLSYFGQGMPLFKIKESINENGLKNNYTEYVAVDKIPEKVDERAPKFLTTGSAFSQERRTKMSFMEKDEKEKLKSQFINYLMHN